MLFAVASAPAKGTRRVARLFHKGSVHVTIQPKLEFSKQRHNFRVEFEDVGEVRGYGGRYNQGRSAPLWC